MCMRVEFHQTKNGLPSLCALSMKARAASVNSSSTVSIRLVVSGAGVLDALLSRRGRTRGVLGRVVLLGGPRMHDAARPEALLEFRVLRVVGVLRLFLGVQVVQVAEELVEPVDRGQELVLVSEVILAELAGGIAQRLEQVGDRRVLRSQALVGARQPHLGQPRADRRLPGDEGGASRGAALLAVPVGEHRPFPSHAVDVGRAVPHDAVIVGTDVVPADVVAPENQNIGLLGRHASSPPRKPSAALDLHSGRDCPVPRPHFTLPCSGHSESASLKPAAQLDQRPTAGGGPPSRKRALRARSPLSGPGQAGDGRELPPAPRQIRDRHDQADDQVQQDPMTLVSCGKLAVAIASATPGWREAVESASTTRSSGSGPRASGRR